MWRLLSRSHLAGTIFAPERPPIGLFHTERDPDRFQRGPSLVGVGEYLGNERPCHQHAPGAAPVTSHASNSSE
jgi:hypothetical protein